MVTFKDFLIKSKFNVKKAKLYQESYDKIMESGLFDKSYYLKAYPHVKKSGMDPLLKFLKISIMIVNIKFLHQHSILRDTCRNIQK